MRSKLIFAFSVGTAYTTHIGQTYKRDDVVRCEDLPIGERCMKSQILGGDPDIERCDCPFNAGGQT